MGVIIFMKLYLVTYLSHCNFTIFKTHATLYFWSSNTVDGRGKISEPHATGTSKLDWRSLESMQIDRNKVQIRTNWQKGTGTKEHENFRNFENFKEKIMSKFASVLNL